MALEYYLGHGVPAGSIPNQLGPTIMPHILFQCSPVQVLPIVVVQVISIDPHEE